MCRIRGNPGGAASVHKFSKIPINIGFRGIICENIRDRELDIVDREGNIVYTERVIV